MGWAKAFKQRERVANMFIRDPNRSVCCPALRCRVAGVQSSVFVFCAFLMVV
jgi:hypothetical protein